MKVFNWYMTLSNIRKFQIGLPVLVMVVFIGFGMFKLTNRKQPDFITINPNTFDPSIYHQPGSNDRDAIKNGDWTILYKYKGDLHTFPPVGRLVVPSDDESAIYEDKDCVFAVAWDKQGRDADEEAKDGQKVWSQMFSGKYPDYDLVGIVRVYKGKRRVFKLATTKERLLLTMPEDSDRDRNMWQALADSTPTSEPIQTPIFK